MGNTASNASEYADAVVAGIRAACDEGAPFGYVNGYDGQTAGDLGELIADADADDRAQLVTYAETGDADDLPGDWQIAGGSDYVAGALDVRYIVNADRSYRAGHVIVTVGGPGAYVDTETRELVVSWGFETVRRELPSAFVDGIDAALGELWEMGA